MAASASMATELKVGADKKMDIDSVNGEPIVDKTPDELFTQAMELLKGSILVSKFPWNYHLSERGEEETREEIIIIKLLYSAAKQGHWPSRKQLVLSVYAVGKELSDEIRAQIRKWVNEEYEHCSKKDLGDRALVMGYLSYLENDRLSAKKHFEEALRSSSESSSPENNNLKAAALSALGILLIPEIIDDHPVPALSKEEFDKVIEYQSQAMEVVDKREERSMWMIADATSQLIPFVTQTDVEEKVTQEQLVRLGQMRQVFTLGAEKGSVPSMVLLAYCHWLSSNGEVDFNIKENDVVMVIEKWMDRALTIWGVDRCENIRLVKERGIVANVDISHEPFEDFLLIYLSRQIKIAITTNNLVLFVKICDDYTRRENYGFFNWETEDLDFCEILRCVIEYSEPQNKPRFMQHLVMRGHQGLTDYCDPVLSESFLLSQCTPLVGDLIKSVLSFTNIDISKGNNGLFWGYQPDNYTQKLRQSILSMPSVPGAETFVPGDQPQPMLLEGSAGADGGVARAASAAASASAGTAAGAVIASAASSALPQNMIFSNRKRKAVRPPSSSSSAEAKAGAEVDAGAVSAAAASAASAANAAAGASAGSGGGASSAAAAAGAAGASVLDDDSDKGRKRMKPSLETPARV